ncbi:MAG: hypothetical protein OXH10_01990 [bacterium]|nr:hypothetical protein [bacterium]MCY3580713.1 hypothetical protein [bacterium]MCY3652846.1 hypothetical protein [bacterium]
MDHSHQYEIEARLVEAWRSHRKIHAEATIAVREASRAATEAIFAAHQSGMSAEQIAEVLKVGLGAIRHRLQDAQRTLVSDHV